MTWRGYELSDAMHDDPNSTGPNSDAVTLIQQKLHH
jgi:hypothetical protein